MTMIQEQIDTLVALQDVELALAKIDRQIAALNDEIAGLDRTAVERETQVSGEKADLDALKKTYRELDAESKINSGMIVKSNEKLRAVKTNKEYQSILKEIEEIRKKNSAIEDRMIEQLDLIESQETAIREKMAQLDGFIESCNQRKQHVEAKITRERETIDELNAKAAAIRTTADPAIIAVLEDVKTKVRGMAVVPAQGAVCMGCHMNIPAQLFNELLRFDELRFCPHCHRIIYWKEKDGE